MKALRLPRRFRPTREGWWFLAATLLVGFAAVNGGLNLLFFLFGMMLFLILASGVLSEIGLRSLIVARRPPSAVHAGLPYLMGIAVTNEKRRLPTFSLEVEDLIEGRPVDRRCYYLKLPAGRTQETAYRNTLPSRGIYRLGGFRLSTRFPFGLIRKSRDVDAPAELVVYPALLSVPADLLTAGLARAGQSRATVPSRRGEFAGLREYRSGDDPREIHWRTSARRGRPFIREAEEESGRTVVVDLDGRTTDGETGAAAFEAAVAMAASIAVKLQKDGFDVGLEAPGTSVPPGAGATHLARVLRALATVAPGLGGAGGSSAAAAGRHAHVRVAASAGSPVVQVLAPGGARRGAA